MAFRNQEHVSKSSIRAFADRTGANALAAAAPGFVPNYNAPGNVADLDTPELRRAWNERIATEYHNLEALHGRFFDLDPSGIPGGAVSTGVKWGGDPAEPNFCFDERVAQELSDWRLTAGHPVHSALSVKGRHETQNEYCEYRIIFARDGDRLRPKRVVFTTELREYWMTLATLAPDRLVAACQDALGFAPSWQDLYGPGVADPSPLTPETRLALFATWVSGAAGVEELLLQGVPNSPIGRLNNEHALFMTHRINGLDDLLYIVLYGAHPYARRDGQRWVKATKDEIFNKTFFGEPRPPIQLACRHADPTAALGAAAQAFEGKPIAFADPLGMYLLQFASDDFLFQGNPLPAGWIQFKRGSETGFYQRLEFGPPDDSPHFLDEITVGDEEAPLKGGFQIAQRLEVGPRLVIGSSSPVEEAEYQRFEVQPVEPYNCAQAAICQSMSRLKAEYEHFRNSEI